MSWVAWPGNAATGAELAELALVRLMHLQGEVHVAGRNGQKEATALLSRTAVETCIAGMWALYGEDTTKRFQDQNAKAVAGMLSFLADLVLSPGLIADLAIEIGESKSALTALNMRDVVVKNGGPTVVNAFYDRFYIPASTLHAHGSASALLRHVGRDGEALDTPTPGWSLRSAIHVADGCVAELASAIAANQSLPTHVFDRYAESHLRRAVPPILSMGGTSLVRGSQLKSVPKMLRRVFEPRRYLNSNEVQTDPEAAVRAFVTSAVADIMAIYEPVETGGLQALLANDLVERLMQGTGRQFGSGE